MQMHVLRNCSARSRLFSGL